MTKTTNILTINFVLILLTGAIPLYVFHLYQNDSIHIQLIQKIVFAVLLCGSILLAIVNNKNRIQIKSSKWLWLIFEVLGILGIVYSLVVFYLIFALQNIGF